MTEYMIRKISEIMNVASLTVLNLYGDKRMRNEKREIIMNKK